MASVSTAPGRARPSRLLLLLPPALAWVLGVTVPRLAWERLDPESSRPYLPLVSVPFLPGGSDVVSIVPWLYRTALLCLACALCVEISKLALLRLDGRPRRGIAFAALVLYQAVLSLDLFRLHAPDWYGFLLHYVGLIELRHEVMQPDVIPVPAPYLGLAWMLATCALLWTLFARIQKEP